MNKLASLEVWLDDSPGEESSYTTHKEGETAYKVVLRPKGDLVDGKQPKPEDVLAHELGHFVADVFQTPAAKKSWFPTATTNEQLSGEREAWHFAEAIFPDFDKEVKEKVLAHYEKGARMYPNIPMSFLRMMGLAR
jgi:hypothetical protein